MTKNRYTDILTSFDPHPLTGDVGRISDADAVRRSVRNLVLTGKYERRLDPNIGANIRSLLFEPMTPFTTIRLRDYIDEVIENYEPRAIVQNIIVQPDYDKQEYFIQIEFRIEQSEAPIFLDVFLERIR
jgi:phage baseplate assembly protein W